MLPCSRSGGTAMGFQERARLVWCFGDSNTYGYDPCVQFGGRYPDPWPELLAESAGVQVVNDGENGRMIPRREPELLRFHRTAAQLHADLLIVLLGGNDLLCGASPDEIALRMETLLTPPAAPEVLLLGPPPLKRGAWVPEDRLVADSVELSRQYRRLAERLGIHYADAGAWDIALTYDGVHFTQQGHIRLAEELAAVLTRL